MKGWKNYCLPVAGLLVLVLVLVHVHVGPSTTHAGSTVTVDNTDNNPVPVREVNNPGNNPFKTALCVEFGGLTCPSGEPRSITVPTTTPTGQTVKRIVIEYVSGICTVTLNPTATFGEVGVVNVQAALASSRTAHFFFPRAIPGANSDGFSSATRIYGDPGGSVGVDFGVLVNLSTAQCRVSITGRLVTD